MAKRSIRLELTLTRLYPSLTLSVTANPVIVNIDKKNIISLLFVLKKSILHRYFLNDLIALDLLKTNRFELLYSFISYTINNRLTVKTLTSDSIESISNLFSASSWLEREVWDLFGVYFTKTNFDLRRILTDYGFSGHPLRKDFPVVGYYELRYSEKKKRVISVPVSFQQELRIFKLSSPWIKNIQQ